MPRTLTVLNRQGGQRTLFRVEPHHAPEIDGAEDIDVVQNKGFLQTPAGPKKEMRGLLQAAAGVKQLLLARDFNAHAEVIVGLQVIDDHLRVVMRVDNRLVYAKGAQTQERNLQQRAAGNC